MNAKKSLTVWMMEAQVFHGLSHDILVRTVSLQYGGNFEREVTSEQWETCMELYETIYNVSHGVY